MIALVPPHGTKKPLLGVLAHGLIEKLNSLRPLLKAVTPQPLRITLLPRVIIIKWDNFDILATGRSDIHCKIKETLLIRDLKPALNENVGSEKLFLY